MNATVISLSILLRHTRSVTVGGRDIHPIKWRAKYGGMDASMVSQMKAMEEEDWRPDAYLTAGLLRNKMCIQKKPAG
jgi:putative transposase